MHYRSLSRGAAATLAALVLAALLYAQEAPRIVESVPAMNAENLDPNLRHVRIVFDRDMMENRFLKRGSQGWPKWVNPVWEDKRTFVYEMRLEPGTTYEIWLNSDTGKGFRSTDGTALEPVCWRFTTAGEHEAESQPADRKEQGPEAPSIVELVPALDAENVDATLKVIRIVFDRDMEAGHTLKRGSQGWPTWGDSSWEDKRTFVSEVILRPSTTYEIWLNGDTGNGFCSTAGAGLRPVRWRFTTTGAAKGQSGPAVQMELNRAAWFELKRAIDDYYSYRDLRRLDWKGIYFQYEQSLVTAPTTSEWMQRAAAMLSVTKDMHIWLEYGNENARAMRRTVPWDWNDDVIRRAVPDVRMVNETFAAGRTSDGIGYIGINTLSRESAADFDAFDDIMSTMKDTKAMIVDLRANAGGSEPLGEKVAGWFTSERVLYAKHVYRDPKAAGGFGSVNNRRLDPAGKGRFYSKPVYALCGKNNMSSADAFVLMFEACPNATVVGGRTYGSSGNPKPHTMPNGVKVYLPSWKAMRPDGTCFEGEGIAPDVLVEPAPEAFGNSDPVLAKALELARGRGRGAEAATSGGGR